MCSKFLYEVTIGAPPQNGQCCYNFSTPVDGRPFIVDGRSRHADVIERSDWCSQPFDWNDAQSDGQGDPFERSADGLAPLQRARLADAWLADARAEHASIASFARLTLQLLSLGAPPDLLAASQRATEDEIAHAQLCFTLASRFAGQPLGPNGLAMVGAVTDVTLTELAVAAVHEGCVGETTAAVLAGERLEEARDPRVRAALVKIAEDESRHAELAWRTVVWAIERGGESVYDAVRAAFAEAVASQLTEKVCNEDDDADTVLASYGCASRSTLRRVQKVVAKDIVLPIAASLATLVAERTRATSRKSDAIMT